MLAEPTATVLPYAPPGEMIDIGGRRLHAQIAGQGGATVVLEAAILDFHLTWALVALDVAQFARVVSYDRAGQGWSDPGPEPRTSAAIVDELHRLLERAGEQGPYVLVDWSCGGLNMRLYAYTFHEEVAGLVLLDASHEAQFEVLGGRQAACSWLPFGPFPGSLSRVCRHSFRNGCRAWMAVHCRPIQSGRRRHWLNQPQDGRDGGD